MRQQVCKQTSEAGAILQHSRGDRGPAVAEHTCLHRRKGRTLHRSSRTRTPRPSLAISCALHERRTVERMIPEDDPRYRRVDMSDVHAWRARRAFAESVARGESGINLAEAALQVAAEDDALVSHSTVPLPVQSFHSRISRLANGAHRSALEGLPGGATDADRLQAIQEYLFQSSGYGLPAFGRSNVPSGVVMDNPGVYENAKYAYLHETLIAKRGIPAVLAILLEEVCQRLLSSGAIDFAVRVACPSLDRLPQAQVIPGLDARALTRPDGSLLNTCSSDVLAEMLRFLKRAYWPFSWQSRSSAAAGANGNGSSAGSSSSGGGFASAAKAWVPLPEQVWLEGEERAEQQAIARSAKHRLERGIWTSPGAGDLRRALAAAERLCILLGDQAPLERRDVAVLYLHAGDLAAARPHLAAYACSAAAKDATREEEELVARLQEALAAVPDLAGAPDPPLLSAQSALARPRPVFDPESRLPLTW